MQPDKIYSGGGESAIEFAIIKGSRCKKHLKVLEDLGCWPHDRDREIRRRRRLSVDLLDYHPFTLDAFVDDSV